MDVTNEISLIECVLGEPYGVIPEIRKNTRWNRANGFIEKNGLTVVGIGCAVLEFVTQRYAMYMPKIHVCFLPDFKQDDKDRFHYVAHELVHGYHWQNPRIEDFLKTFDSTPEQWFVKECIIEGVAEYVSVEAQRVKGDYDIVASYHLTFCSLAYHSDLELMVNAHLQAMSAQNRKLRKEMTLNLNIAAYGIGYEYIRAIRESMPEQTVAGVIRYITEHPPNSIRDIFERIQQMS